MMDHHPDNGTIKRQTESRRWHNLLRSGAVLLIFLLISCSLIFGVATLGVRRDTKPWLDVSLVSQLAGNYEVDDVAEPRPRIREEVIEDAEKDALVVTVAPPTPTPTPTPTLPLTPTLTLTPGELLVTAGGPYSGDEGSQVSVRARALGIVSLVPNSITYRWDLDDDGQYNDKQGASASVIFFDEGEYPISVEARDLGGRVATDTTTVLVRNVPPIVKLGDDQSADEAEEVSFVATAEDPGHDILFFEWNFGDGTVVVLDTLRPRHTYADNGDYLVRLRVADNDDAVSEDTMIVRVANLPPQVDAGLDQVVTEGESLTFRGTATDPAGDQDPLIYAWDFDYDGDFEADVYGQTVSNFYPDGPAGSIIALQVMDDDDGQTLDTLQVTVNNKAPAITSIKNDGPTAEGSPMTLTVSATDVAPDTLSYAFDWDNDGSFDDVNQPPTVSHIWDNQGDYDVGIRVTDKDGGRTLTTTAVSAFNEPPIAVALGPDGARFEGSAVYFSGQDSTDPGNLDVLSFNWNFGDGNSAQGVDVTHSYADNRVYSATLTVTDDSGAASSDSVAVTILNANPVADAGGDREVDEGVSLNFVGSATDPGTADTHTFDWDFSYDGVTFNPEAPGPSVSQTFPDGPATVQVALRVRDDDYQNPPVGGNQIGESIDTLQLTVKNVPPGNVKANGPYTGVEGRPVPMAAATATDVSSDTLTYEWDVNGDGTYDLNGQAVTYTWFTARSYSVTLRVRDDDGGSATDTTNVMITNGPPFADAGGPYTGSEGSPIVLDSSGTTDPSTPPDVLTYRWNFGDGSPGVITTSVTVRHTYADEGVYTATLDVDDGRGGTDTDIASVTVNNQPPAILSANATPNLAPEGSTVNFDAAATDPGVTDVLTYEWDFADGTPLGNGTPVTHLYSDDNLYVVALTVRDGDGGLVTTTIPVTITNVAPTAAFTTTAAPFREGIPIRFDSSSSSDPAGPSDPLTYAWDFGDGSAITSTTRVTITHVYPDNGVYTATLRVNDDDGGVGTARRALTIQNRPPVANAGGPYSTTIGITVTLTGSATDVPSDTLTYGWDLDDNGTYETPGRVTTVVFTATGSYTVTVRVTDDDGGVGTDSAIIQVNSVLPLAWPIIPYYLIRAMRAKWRKKKRRDKNKQK